VRSRIGALVLVCLLAVCGRAGVTSAHGDDPRISIDIAALAPGGALTVHGFDFPYEDDVELALRGASGDTELGSVTTDLEGSFTHTVAVPVEQPLGAYVVVATDSHHEVASTPFMVEGAPLADDDGIRLDEGDSLLAPMPTDAPGVVAESVAAAVGDGPSSAATTTAAAVERSAAAQTSAPVVDEEGVVDPGDSGPNTAAVLVAAAIVTALLAVAVVIVRGRGRTHRLGAASEADAQPASVVPTPPADGVSDAAQDQQYQPDEQDDDAERPQQRDAEHQSEDQEDESDDDHVSSVPARRLVQTGDDHSQNSNSPR